VRATTLLNRVLDLPGLRVVGVDLDDPAGGGSVVIDVCLRRRVLACRCVRSRRSAGMTAVMLTRLGGIWTWAGAGAG
jgi:hypothetical protein